nr:MAG TPA: immunity protein [Caudoviricetes sp.]
MRASRECGWMTYLYNSCGFPPGFLTIPRAVLCK